jgi:hypothetical protein
MLARLNFEFPVLVKEMFDQLPKWVWKSETTTFLDPSMGGGQFVKEIEKRLREAGHSDENIKKRVFGFEKNIIRVNFAIDKNKLVGTYNVLNFLSWEPNMKFDVIVGNPPYQAAKNGDYSFWARFVDKSNTMLADNGYLSMVIPIGWMSPTNDIRQGQRSIMRDIFAKENTCYINVDKDLGKKYFYGIGQKFTWFVLQKGNYKITKLDLGKNQIEIDISKMPFLPNTPDSVGVRIISKISNSKDRWNFTRYIMKESWSEVSFEKTNSFQFERINGNSNHLDKVVYTENDCRTRKLKKVVLPRDGSEYRFVVDDGKMGCTSAYVMSLSETDLTESAEVYFNSALIKWLGKNKFTQFNEGALINTVSKMDFTKHVTETDIYNFYGLTQEEIDYIETVAKM